MAVSVQDFLEYLAAYRIHSFYGVPDSLLQEVSFCLTREGDSLRSIVCANEGSAVGIAIGDYVSSGNPCCVYMQNSGLGNALNPLVSLAAKKIFSVPMLLLIGWRGEPDVPDEPQHALQGEITLDLLDDMHIFYEVLDSSSWKEQASVALSIMNHESVPVALVIRKNFFEKTHQNLTVSSKFLFHREEMLDALVSAIPSCDVVVSTTGKCSRELFELRESHLQSHETDLLIVGGMGHASSISLGMSLNCVERNVWCLDGDGALLMHTGALIVAAQNCPLNFKYVVNQNGVHESVGGQPNAAMSLDISKLLKACGFDEVFVVSSPSEVTEVVNKMSTSKLRCALVMQTTAGSRDDLGRPTITPFDNIRSVMDLFENAND